MDQDAEPTDANPVSAFPPLQHFGVGVRVRGRAGTSVGGFSCWSGRCQYLGAARVRHESGSLR